jgi:sarcosine oxidase
VSTFEVGVVGLGAMGSMAALELARRGARVVGFDRFHPPHAHGSSAGKSRIIREAYFEHPQYVPLVQRAYRLWPLLERDGGRRLLVPTGGLMLGPPGGAVVAGARRSAREHGLPCEDLDAVQVRKRFPMFAPSPDEAGLFEPRAGVLLPEAAIATALELAVAAGAELHLDEPVLAWEAGARIAIRTGRAEYLVDRLVLAAGAWMAGPLPGVSLELTVARQTLFWFAPATLREDVSPARMPIFIWEWEPGSAFYGFPDLGDGVKLAIHHQGEPADPDGLRRPPDAGEEARLRGIMAARTPMLNGPLLGSTTCLYTNTSDGDFVLGRAPGDARVILASPCSGHGFKFAPAIGEVLADLVLDRPPGFDLTPFRPGRDPSRRSAPA